MFRNQYSLQLQAKKDPSHFDGYDSPLIPDSISGLDRLNNGPAARPSCQNPLHFPDALV